MKRFEALLRSSTLSAALWGSVGAVWSVLWLHGVFEAVFTLFCALLCSVTRFEALSCSFTLSYALVRVLRLYYALLRSSTLCSAL